MSRLTLEEFCKQNACEEILSHLVSKQDYTLPYASHVKVNWVCSEGHNFDNEVYKYTTPGRLTFKRFSCPVCKGQRVLEGVNDLATVNKDMSLEWDYNLNTLLPTQVTSGSHKSVWWRCKRGHSWRARISARTYASEGCPFCSKIPRTSLGEQYLFLYCKRAFDSLTYNRYKLDGVEFDVYIPDASLAIEFDGSYWHSLKDTSYKRDFCSERGVSLIRVIESSKTEVTGLDYYFRSSGDVRRSDLHIILGILFSHLSSRYGCNEPLIDLESDYMLVRERVSANSRLSEDILSLVKPFWDERLNGYSLDYLTNDGSSKFWRCKYGHSFSRRLDVIMRFDKIVCPCCEGKFKWRFYLINVNNSLFVLDFETGEVEVSSPHLLLNAVEVGINVRGVCCVDGVLKYNLDYFLNVSDSTLHKFREGLAKLHFTSVNNLDSELNACEYLYKLSGLGISSLRRLICVNYS